MHLPSDMQFTTLCQSGGTGGVGAEFGKKDEIRFRHIKFEVPRDRNKCPAGNRKCTSGAEQRHL